MAAGNVVGQVQVLVLPDGSQFTAQLQAILNQAAGQATQAGANIGRAVGQGVTSNTAAIGQSIDRDVTAKFFQAAASATAFTGAVMGTRAIIERTVGKLAGLFDQLAQAQAGFTAIVGEKAGGKLLDEIRIFAKESPFVTQQLVNYSQQLLGVGMASEKIVPLLKDTGNVIASVGGDTNNLSRVLFALTQIKTVGRLMGQDAMQLQSALIPITKMLSEFLGKSTAEVKKMQEQGRISADMVFSAIQMAGSKVPHAMDNAVKNIQGARSVLSDTITIMLQDASALRGIYDDIVVGIQKFAAKLGDPAVQSVIQDAFTSIGRAYEALKPALLSMMQTMGEGSLTGLKTFTTIMGTFAKVLDSIPEPVLNGIARTLAAIATLKAPMMLMRYVQQFKTMASIFQTSGGSSGLIQRIMGTTKAMEASSAATSGMTASTQAQTAATTKSTGAVRQWIATLKEAEIQAMRTAEAAALSANIGGAPLPAGMIAAPQSVSKMAIARRAMTIPLSPKMQFGASAGLMAAGTLMSGSGDAGTQAGGQVLSYTGMGMMMGGPVGALVGGGIGAFTAILDAEEKAAEAHKQKMAEIAGETAKAWNDEWSQMFGEGATGKKATAMRDQMQNLRKAMKAPEMRAQSALAAGDMEGFQKWIGVAEDARLLYQPQYDEIKSQYEDLYDKSVKTAGEVFEKFPEEVQKKMSPELQKVTSVNGVMTTVMGDPEQIEKWAKQYGLTLEELGTLGSDEVNRIVMAFEGLDTAQQQAIKSANLYNEASQKGKEIAQGIYGVQAQAIGGRLAAISAEKSAIEAATAAYKNQGNETAQLQAKQAELSAQSAVLTETYARTFDELTKAGMDKPTAELKAQAIAIREAERATARYKVVAISSFKQVADKYKIAGDELARILDIEGEIDPTLNIVVTAEVAKALEQLSAVQASITRLKILARTSGMDVVGDSLKEALAKEGQLISDIKRYTTFDKGAAAKGGGGGGGPTFEDKVKSAAAALENAVKSAMQSAEQAAEAWKSTIKQRTQYEQAVSAGRALSNVQRQMQDITFLRGGIAQLKTMGLSETALAALDINALTDVRQVKKLLSSSPEQLAALSSAIAERDKLAGQLSSDRMQEQSRKTIVLAIVEAAGILGYKVDEQKARQIAANFNITGTTDVAALVNDLMRMLSGGKVSL